MKISEITTDYLIEYCNAYTDDTKLMEIFRDSAIKYIKDYTGLEDLDQYEDITLAFLSLVAEMYDNRAFTTDKVKVNSLVESILNLHCRNLL